MGSLRKPTTLQTNTKKTLRELRMLLSVTLYCCSNQQIPEIQPVWMFFYWSQMHKSSEKKTEGQIGRVARRAPPKSQRPLKGPFTSSISLYCIHSQEGIVTRVCVGTQTDVNIHCQQQSAVSLWGPHDIRTPEQTRQTNKGIQYKLSTDCFICRKKRFYSETNSWPSLSWIHYHLTR